ncbi:MAG: aminopeptidase [Bacteroidales bacterium]|nr:aminopeptidase [Bacteroidales bacterium]
MPAFTQPNSTDLLSPSVKNENNELTTIFDLQTTPVKNQAATGTCWSFATTSFIESELLRLGKGEYDLSEMFIVRHNYINRLRDNYLRKGQGNTGEGGNAHDFIRVFREYGIVPDEVYTGLNYGSPVHNHSELQAFIKAVSAVPLQRKKESEQYYEIVNAVLDTYLGETPGSFTFKGVSYTPLSFAGSLGINPDDYVEITSFIHFPFYSREVLEIADNWAKALFYNVPLNELIEIIDYSLSNGFTVNWDGDTSEKGFSHKNGFAVISPLKSDDNQPASDHQRRQEGYISSATTDDHAMHITGLVKDKDGKKYYKTKNSWGPDRNSFGGYLYMSEDYVREKTLFIMVHKDAIPSSIRTKLGI